MTTTTTNRFNEVIRAPRTAPMPDAERQRLLEIGGHPPPEIANVLEKARVELATIDADSRFTAQAKQTMRDEKRQAARQQFEALTAKHIEQSLRELRQEEGQSRAGLLNEPPRLLMDVGATEYERADKRARVLIDQQHEANTLRRIDLDIREIDAATDVADVIAMFDEAAAIGGEVMRRVGKHALRQATAMVSETRCAGTESIYDRSLGDMRTRFAEFAKANPLPAERLRQTLEKKAAREAELAAQARRWRQAYGLE